MHAIRRFLDFIAGTTFHISWVFLGALMLAGVFIAGWAVRRL
jgi:hypothetical protein